MRIIDFRNEKRRWGHDCVWEKGGDNISVYGWCSPRPEVGDFMLMEESGDHYCLYKIKTIDYPGDPPDMFFAECRFQKGSTLSEDLEAAINELFTATAK